MKHILCYGDSLTWGYNPTDGSRYSWEVRWTGVLQRKLAGQARILEAGLNGRTVCAESWLLPHRSGMEWLPTTLESHAPLDLVILQLGTNDCSPTLGLSPEKIAGGCLGLVWTVQQPRFGDAGKCPRVLLLAPPHLGELAGTMKLFFTGAEPKVRALAPLYREVAEATNSLFLDVADVATAGADGVHLGPNENQRLADAIFGILNW